MHRSLFAIFAVAGLAGSAPGFAAAAEKTFFRDGGWSGEIAALRWSDLDSPKASAVGRHTKATATEACSGRDGPRAVAACVKQLTGEPPVRIFADCSAGVTWRDDGKWTFRLTDDAKAGKLKPLDDEAAWTEKELSHRARFTAASWLGFLCPASSKTWRLGETG